MFDFYFRGMHIEMSQLLENGHQIQIFTQRLSIHISTNPYRVTPLLYNGAVVPSELYMLPSACLWNRARTVQFTLDAVSHKQSIQVQVNVAMTYNCDDVDVHGAMMKTPVHVWQCDYDAAMSRLWSGDSAMKRIYWLYAI